MTKEIILEKLKTLEIKQITLNKDKFGVLTFDRAYPLLHKLRKIFVEFDELNYKDLLIHNEIEDIDNYKQGLLDYIKRINSINPAEADSNFNKNIRDQIENDIEGFYNSTVKRSREPLIYLRQEVALKSKDQQDLQEQQKVTAQAQLDYETVKKQITKELKDIRARRAKVEKEQGEFIAIGLGKDFGDQAEQYQAKADNWLKQRNIWLRVLSYIISGNILLFFILLIGHLKNENLLNPDIVFNFQYGAVKFALLLLLSYAIGFCSRNYNINSGLAATNRHRKNVAEVLLNALSSQLTDEAKSEIMHLAAKEMFKHLPVGYISKEHQSDSGPIFEIAKQAFPKLKE